MIKNNIKKIISDRGISVHRFVKETGIALGTGYDLCNNEERIPNINVLEKICGTYNLQPGEILTWIPSHKPDTEIYKQCLIVYSKTIDWEKEVTSKLPIVCIVGEDNSYNLDHITSHPLLESLDYAIAYKKLSKAEKARKSTTKWGGEKNKGGSNGTSMLTPKEVINIIFRAENLTHFLLKSD